MRKIMLALISLLAANLALASPTLSSAYNFWFNVLTPSPTYTVLNQSQNVTWKYPPACNVNSPNQCSFSITTQGNDVQFFVTIGKDWQHYCQFLIETYAGGAFGQSIKVLKSSNCIGNITYKAAQSDGYNQGIVIY